ncbi:MAG: NAD(P)-binding domain-containing protein [Actinobacteria bacterium]|nr:NAD(P)-binding domain-containing protein [Actinomycetota bacterium]
MGEGRKGKVAVIGAGLMGHGIAQAFAAHDFRVYLADTGHDRLDEALSRVRGNLELMVSEGAWKAEDITPLLERISTTIHLEEAVSEVELVIEAIPEEADRKRDLFREVDALCPPDVILATNTSVISISEIARDAAERQRIVGTHFWNPPFLVPLVEVIPGNDSAPWAVDRACELLVAAGKRPVRVKKDVPGFVGNRLQHALWREAVSLVERGIADAETVDEVVKLGFGMRLPVLGPLENADMVGLDLTLQIHEYVLRHLESSPQPSPLLKGKVEQGELGFSSGRGFRSWTPQQMEECRVRLQRHLLEWCGVKGEGHGDG